MTNLQKEVNNFNFTEVEKTILKRALTNYTLSTDREENDPYKKVFWDMFVEDTCILSLLRTYIEWTSIIFSLYRKEIEIKGVN